MEMEKVSDIGTHRLSDVVGLTGSSPNFVANIKRISELINFRPPPPNYGKTLVFMIISRSGGVEVN